MGEGLPPEAYELEDKTDVLKDIREELQNISGKLSNISNSLSWFKYTIIVLCIGGWIYLIWHIIKWFTK
jgi:hypothetical protein